MPSHFAYTAVALILAGVTIAALISFGPLDFLLP